ncbi:hypothetical protein ACMFMG_006167 [Clarireedia jacksonii]
MSSSGSRKNAKETAHHKPTASVASGDRSASGASSASTDSTSLPIIRREDYFRMPKPPGKNEKPLSEDKMTALISRKLAEYTKAREVLVSHIKKYMKKDGRLPRYTPASEKPSGDEAIAAEVIKTATAKDLETIDVGKGYLHNCKAIERGDLYKKVEGLPEAGLLHTHNNMTFRGRFLIEYAKNVESMYIRSDRPLTTAWNMEYCRIQFNPISEADFKKGSKEETDPKKILRETDLFIEAKYNPDFQYWMKYKSFLDNFKLPKNTQVADDNDGVLEWPGRSVAYDKMSSDQKKRCKNAENWLYTKGRYEIEEVESKLAHYAKEEKKKDENEGKVTDIETDPCKLPWILFDFKSQFWKGLFIPKSAVKKYTRLMISDLRKARQQYVEIRHNFMKTNTLKNDNGTIADADEISSSVPVLKIIEDALKEVHDKIKKKKERILADMEEEKEQLREKIDGIKKKSKDIPDGLKEKAKNLHNKIQEIKENGCEKFDMKVIYTTPRSMGGNEVATKAATKWALEDVIKMKKLFPDLIIGFDLVGPEDRGEQLSWFLEDLIKFRATPGSEDIPFLFHGGETLKRKIAENLIDAYLLGARRVSHAFALTTMPYLFKCYRDANILIEVCGTTNEILGLAKNVAEHRMYTMIKHGLPVSLNTDNAVMFNTTVRHEICQFLLGSKDVSLMTLKKVLMDSLVHSRMNEKQKQDHIKYFESQWEEYCGKIADRYRNHTRTGERSSQRSSSRTGTRSSSETPGSRSQSRDRSGSDGRESLRHHSRSESSTSQPLPGVKRSSNDRHTGENKRDPSKSLQSRRRGSVKSSDSKNGKTHEPRDSRDKKRHNNQSNELE